MKIFSWFQVLLSPLLFRKHRYPVMIVILEFFLPASV
jgi:hypothetical protein